VIIVRQHIFIDMLLTPQRIYGNMIPFTG
jgi:hypothetical protein